MTPPVEGYLRRTVREVWAQAPALVRDPYMGVGVVVWVLCALPSLVPVLPEDLLYSWADQYSDVPSLLLVMGLAVVRARSVAEGRERFFWGVVAATLVCWLSVRLLYLLIPYETWGVGTDLTSDLLYLAGYFLLAVVLEDPPREERVDEAAKGARVESVGTLVFAMGILTYFVLAPSVFTPDLYAAWVSSLLLYSVLDVYLLARCLRIVGQADLQEGWRTTFGWLGATFGLWLAGDLTEGLMYLEWLPFVYAGTPLDLLWHAPSLTLLVALRARSLGAEERGSVLVHG